MRPMLVVLMLLCRIAHAGDFERHAVENVHDIFLRDSKGGVIARISIAAGLQRSESWEHLKVDGGLPSLAGPDNRRIVTTRTGFSVSAYGRTSELKPTKAVQRVVDELKANNGLLVDPAEKRVIGFEDPAFEAALRERLKSVKAVITFKSGA